MIWHIVGITFGSLIIATAFGFYLFSMLKKNKFKRMIKDIGQSAEDKINADIKIWVKHTKNKFIPATVFKYKENKVFEVDSIIVSHKAIIVVEIKSISGVIKGDARQQSWIKQLGQKQHSISNPIIQNDKHIYHIVQMTKTKLPIISLIIFSNRSESLIVENKPDHVVLTRHVNLFKTLDEIDSSLSLSLNDDDVKRTYNNISHYRTKKSADLKLHKRITTQGGK